MSKLLRTIKRLKDPRDLWLFLQITWMLALLPGRIRKKSLPDLLAEIDPGVSPIRRDEDTLEKTAGFVDSLLKYRVIRRYGTCFLRSLALFRFLRLQGWPVEIHFGVRKATVGDEGEDVRAAAPAMRLDITGHSWLVLEGKPFLETEYQPHSFATTYTYPR